MKNLSHLLRSRYYIGTLLLILHITSVTQASAQTQSIKQLTTLHFKIYFSENNADVAHIIAKMSEELYLNNSDCTGADLQEPISIIVDDTSDTKYMRKRYHLKVSPLRHFNTRSILITHLPNYMLVRQKISRRITEILLMDLLSLNRFQTEFDNSKLYTLPTVFSQALISYLSVKLDNQALYTIHGSSYASLSKFLDGGIPVYRALFAFIEQNYGAAAIGRITTAVKNGATIEYACSSVTALSDEMLLKKIKNHYQIQLERPPFNTQFDNLTTIQISHDGKYKLEYTKTTLKLYSKRSGLWRKERTFSMQPSQIQSNAVGNFSSQSNYCIFSSITISGVNVFIYNLTTQKFEKSISLPFISISSLQYSEKKKELFFSAATENSIDIFSYNLIQKKLTKLTNDLFIETDLLLSHDQKSLIFISNYDVLNNYDRSSNSLFSIALSTGKNETLYQSNYTIHSLRQGSNNEIYFVESGKAGGQLLSVASESQTAVNTGIKRFDSFPPTVYTVLDISSNQAQVLLYNGDTYADQSFNLMAGKPYNSSYKPENDLRSTSYVDISKMEMTTNRTKNNFLYNKAEVYAQGAYRFGIVAETAYAISNDRLLFYGAVDHEYGREPTNIGVVAGVASRILPIDLAAGYAQYTFDSSLAGEKLYIGSIGLDPNRSLIQSMQLELLHNFTNNISCTTQLEGIHTSEIGAELHSINNSLVLSGGLYYGQQTEQLFVDYQFVIKGDATIYSGAIYKPVWTKFSAIKGYPFYGVFYGELLLNGTYLFNKNEHSALYTTRCIGSLLHKNNFLYDMGAESRISFFALLIKRSYNPLMRGSVGVGPFVQSSYYLQRIQKSSFQTTTYTPLFSGISVKAGTKSRLFLTLDAFTTLNYEDGDIFTVNINAGVNF